MPKTYRPITLDILLAAFDASRLRVPEQQLVQLFNQICSPRESYVDFWMLWGVLLPELSSDAVSVTGYLWNTLNPQKQPEISLAKMKNRFFGKFDPDVQKRKKQERDVENQFIRYLDTYCQVGMSGGGRISRREFDGFMQCWAFSCENERDFLMRVVECFRLNEFIDKFGIDSEPSNDKQGGWRKEWNRREQPTSHSRRNSGRPQPAWGNFTEGKREIKQSRRGRSAYGGDRFNRK